MLTTILVLIALCLILGLIEITLTPGLGIAGIGSVGCAIVAVAMVYSEYGLTAALLSTLAALLVLGFALWWIARSKAFNRVAHNTSIDSSAATIEQLSVRPGQRGIALTRLALIGNAEIEGKRVEVKSTGAFINPGAQIEVTEVNEALILVKEV